VGRRSRSRGRDDPPRGGGGGGGNTRLKGEAARWNPRGFGFIKPLDGGEDLFCHVSGITDGNVLREGDVVEYEVQYDDRKGKYRAIEVTGGRQEDDRGGGGGGGGGYGGGGGGGYGGGGGGYGGGGGGYDDRRGGGGYDDRRDSRGYDDRGPPRGGGGGGGGGGVCYAFQKVRDYVRLPCVQQRHELTFSTHIYHLSFQGECTRGASCRFSHN
jgi:cold shock CspA family protein